MQTVTIHVPAHFATADLADIERELIGLIWDKRPALTGKPLVITGIRSALKYSSPNTNWPRIKGSRELRTPGNLIIVRFVY